VRKITGFILSGSYAWSDPPVPLSVWPFKSSLGLLASQSYHTPPSIIQSGLTYFNRVYLASYPNMSLLQLFPGTSSL
jgi:hypothetical protein